jgi:hypothetical protein
MRSRKPASLRSLMFALLSALVFRLIAEQTTDPGYADKIKAYSAELEFVFGYRVKHRRCNGRWLNRSVRCATIL